ncbi:hypothetical protein CKY02_05485 [Photorhabdus bodei]|uniref:Uncharacterized protein n=1 Tax=Photorhabdus bodei TaxID=2029681 RepID=A0A329XF34_9GAMM|nr:hypothetical protein CKY02_05485 [Photorhabdus bodei]
MNVNVTRINHQPFEIWFRDKFFKQSFPYVFVMPPTKTAMHIFPIAIIGGGGINPAKVSLSVKSRIRIDKCDTSLGSLTFGSSKLQTRSEIS